MDKRKTSWVFLYNCLYVISSKYSEIAHLESPVFELFDELDSAIIGGLNERSLSFFMDQHWVDQTLKEELIRFRDYLNGISPEYWNAKDFDGSEDWRIARGWACLLMEKLNMRRNGWNSEGSVVIYTD
jgi:hypothetical protein